MTPLDELRRRARRFGCRWGFGPRRLIPFLLRLKSGHVVRIMSMHAVPDCPHYRLELDLDVWEMATLSVMPQAGSHGHDNSCLCAICLAKPRHLGP